MSKIGLVLGKFCPLTKGHEYLISTALDECEKVYIMVYEDDCTTVPVMMRAEWIAQFCENFDTEVEIIKCYNCPQEVGYTEELIATHDEYILSRVGDRGITHFYSSERYGEHVAKALNAVDRRVDMERKMVPISGTIARYDLSNTKARKYVSDNVCNDLITRVVFLGSESTGKTTLASNMANRLKTLWVSEYGHEYWMKFNKDGMLNPSQLCLIAYKQKLNEEHAASSSDCRRFLFCDTSAITTRMFCEYYHEEAPEILKETADEMMKKYDLVFVCDTDVPFDNSFGRRSIEANLIEQKKLIEELNLKKIPFYLISGDIEERVEFVMKKIKNFDKFDWRQE
jgi:NadR type nicotinamide-nucleotide adenylyltransferase